MYLLLQSMACGGAPGDSGAESSAESAETGSGSDSAESGSGESGSESGVDTGPCDSASRTPGWADADGDGYGDPSAPGAFCAGTAYVTNDSDCDDADATVNPAASDTCDGVDRNCDGTAASCGGVSGVRTLPGDGTALNVTDARAAATMDVDGDGTDELFLAPLGVVSPPTLYALRGPYSAGMTEADAWMSVEVTDSGYNTDVHAGWDLDADGAEDLVVAAPERTTSAGGFAGTVWVLPPEAGTWAIDDIVASTFEGDVDNAELGSSVAAGDVDGDGSLDLMVGSYDSARVFAGPLAPGDQVLGNAVVEVVQNQRNGLDIVFSDLDGDGFDDLVMPIRGDGVYLVGGGMTGSLAISDGTRVIAADEFLAYPYGVVAFDHNGDGYPDLLVEWLGDDDYTGPFGLMGLHEGPFTTTQTVDDRIDLYDSSFLAPLYQAVGDVNGDGLDDLSVEWTNWSYASVVLTSPMVASGDLRDDAYARVVHDQGHGPQAIGDLNGDGYGDLALPCDEAVYLLFGP